MNREDLIVAAVNAGEIAQVEALLAEDPTLIMAPTPEGSLVLTAAYRHADDLVQTLLRHNPPLDIFEAATVGHAERIAALLAGDPGLVQGANTDGFEPLHLAAFFGQVEAVRTLLAGGATIDRIMQSKVPYVPSNTALHSAVAGGPHHDVIDVLIHAGADVNVLDSNGHSPLHAAAFHNHAGLIEFLVAQGADVNLHGAGALSPLALALKHGKEAAAAALRAAGATA